ncbi:hypothetical protein LINGRAHAP2_LOCUS15093 [Linum grandiflorum]
MNLGCYSITRAEMRGIVEGLKIAWSWGILWIRVQSNYVAAISILPTTLCLIINMRFLFCSVSISANNNGKSLSPISTAKRIVLRITWPISVILLISVYIFLICVI